MTEDPTSDQAILTRHRALHSTVHPDVAAAARTEWHRTHLAVMQRDQAIVYLQRILNRSRTATESWQAEQEARQWLESIGCEPT